MGSAPLLQLRLLQLQLQEPMNRKGFDGSYEHDYKESEQSRGRVCIARSRFTTILSLSPSYWTESAKLKQYGRWALRSFANQLTGIPCGQTLVNTNNREAFANLSCGANTTSPGNHCLPSEHQPCKHQCCPKRKPPCVSISPGELLRGEADSVYCPKPLWTQGETTVPCSVFEIPAPNGERVIVFSYSTRRTDKGVPACNLVFEGDPLSPSWRAALPSALETRRTV